MANSEDPDEMQHNAAFHQGLHRLLKIKTIYRTEIHHNLKKSTCDPLKYTVGSPILIVLIRLNKPCSGACEFHYLNIDVVYLLGRLFHCYPDLVSLA